ncbi:D-2-hydroxyacid dehydrogenase family protein [Litorivicinus sp.]|nr:D-2-hydroxyacid dehydrogenase family protein [Litorivicinus sp.]
MRIAILDDYYQRAQNYANWGSANFATVDFIHEHIEDENKLVEALLSYEAVGLMRERTSFTRSLIERLPNLRLIVTTGKQNASIDISAASEHGVTVCGTSSPGHATAELAFMLIMMLCRNVMPLVNGLKNDGVWQPKMGADLRAKTLGILGLGRLGSQVAKLGQTIGMNVIAWSTNLTEKTCAEHGVRYVTKTALFEESDFVSIHLKLSDRSKHLVGSQELELLGPNGYLVNTSRAEIINTEEALKALDNDLIAGLATDVYTKEPANQKNPFVNHKRVLATPHIGYCTEETFEVFYTDMLGAFEGFNKGQPINVIKP